MWEAQNGPRLLFIEFDPEGNFGQLAAKLTYAKKAPDALLGVETVQIGPSVLGNYTAKECLSSGQMVRELVLKFDTFIAAGEVVIQQPIPSPPDLPQYLNASGSPLSVLIGFQPTLIGKIFGLKHVQMTQPISSHINMKGVVGRGDESLGDLIKNNEKCFTDAASCLQLSNGSMLVDSELCIRCEQRPPDMPPILEEWLPSSPQPEIQRILIARIDNQMHRIVAVSGSTAYCPDIQGVLESKSTFKVRGFNANLLETHGCRSYFVFVMTDHSLGANRRIELWDCLSADLPEDLKSFMEGVQFVEEQMGARLGGLTVRVLRTPSPETETPGCVDLVLSPTAELIGGATSSTQARALEIFKKGETAAVNALRALKLL
jgi:hypothetical protein